MLINEPIPITQHAIIVGVEGPVTNSIPVHRLINAASQFAVKQSHLGPRERRMATAAFIKPASVNRNDQNVSRFCCASFWVNKVSRGCQGEAYHPIVSRMPATMRESVLISWCLLSMARSSAVRMRM